MTGLATRRKPAGGDLTRLRRDEVAGGVLALVVFAAALALSVVLKPSTAPLHAPDVLPWSALRPQEPERAAKLAPADLARMRDDDPRAARLLAAMKEQGDKAAVVMHLDGERVALSGFVVPLDGEQGQVREFLLVPYHGACIHVPPPPANQIVLVRPARPMALRSMDAVLVRGQLQVRRSTSAFGASGYRIDEAEVAVR